jgi:protein-tyrosine phosphatase
MSTGTRPPSVLFVCTGNICRSPTAQALLLHKAAAQGLRVHADSAAISDEELGNPPDPRALAELRRRGVPMPAHRARMAEAADFRRFDLLLGMTSAHVRALQRLAPAQAPKAGLLMRYAEGHGAIDVPDPWYGGERDFIEAFDLIEAGVDGLLAHWAARRDG